MNDFTRDLTEGMIGPGSYVDRRTYIVDWERLEFAIGAATILSSIFSFAGMEPVQAVGTGFGLTFLADGLYHKYRSDSTGEGSNQN